MLDLALCLLSSSTIRKPSLRNAGWEILIASNIHLTCSSTWSAYSAACWWFLHKRWVPLSYVKRKWMLLTPFMYIQFYRQKNYLKLYGVYKKRIYGRVGIKLEECKNFLLLNFWKLYLKQTNWRRLQSNSLIYVV